MRNSRKPSGLTSRVSRARRAITWGLLGVFLGTLPGAPAAIAAPEGERVVKGEATFERDGTHTHITTKSRETIVNYDRFGIAEGESVRIDQPSRRSRILNRVPRGEESRIDGELSSNGIVYILNPAGVFFGDRAVLRVNELVAGAASISNKDFMKGVDRFTDVTGDVGVAAGADVKAVGDVLLVGRHVENMGSISSERGMIAMVAGGGVLLTRHGGHVVVHVDGPGEAPANDVALVQGGDLTAQRVTLAAGDAYSLAMNHTGITRAGEIHVQSEGDGLVQVAGALDASNAAPGGQGGSITVQGSRIAVQDAVLDASGAAGGGEIRLGGDLRGGGDMATARRVYVDADSALRADATEAGDGGKIVVFADEQTSFYGALSARGGAQGGDGGFAEISGRSLVAKGEVDLGAEQGATGTLLYDPAKIVIVGGVPGGAADGSDSPDSSAQAISQSRLGQVVSGDTGALVGDAFEIHESEIEGTNANIVLEATNRIEVRGAFDGVDADHPDGVVVVMPGNSLTLRTTGTTVPQGLGSDDLGIDLTADGNESLAWRVSQGGNITISTDLDTVEFEDTSPPKASISVGRLESASASFQPFDTVFADRAQTIGMELPQDRTITVSATRGNITVGAIEADGQDALPPGDYDNNPDTPDMARSASAGAEIDISTQQGDIRLEGPIHARGGSGTNAQGSPGANGAEIDVATQAGDLTVLGDIDVSGGDGRGAIFVSNPSDPEAPALLTGGGAGGAIQLAAHGNDTGEGDLLVTSDLTARGGRGLPTLETIDGQDEVLASPGGFGGAVALSATQTITVGASGTPVVLDASGGDGSAGGGDARNDFNVEDVPGPTLAQSFRITGEASESTNGLVEIHGQLLARGGKARQFYAGAPNTPADVPAIALADMPGGAGGGGGDFSALPGSLDARDMLLELSGGSGSLPSAGPTDPPRDTQGNVFLLGGSGGDVAITAAERADLGGTLSGDPNDPNACCGILSRGGDATNGVGGSGGSVNVTAGDPASEADQDPTDAVVVGDIDVSGGDSTPENDATTVSLAGGIAGIVNLTARERTVGSVLLRGRVGGDGGIGTDGETNGHLHGLGAGVNLSAEDAIRVDESALNPDGSVPDRIVVSGSEVSLGAPNIGTRENEADGLAPIPIAGTARSREEGGDVAIAVGSERVAVEVRSENGLPVGAALPDDDSHPDALEKLTVEMREATGSALVRRGAADLLTSSAADAVSLHTLTKLQTQDDDPSVTYRLNVDIEANETQPKLAIARGAVVLGANGGEIVNGAPTDPGAPFEVGANRGDVVGTGAGAAPHVQSAGGVRVRGRKLGEDGNPLVFAGGGPDAVLSLDAQGDVDAAVPDSATPFHGIEIIQFDAAGAADVDLRNADGIQIVADGTDRSPASRIARAVTTDSGTGLSYRLQALPGGASVDEADLWVDEVKLGGDGLLLARGDVLLRSNAAIATPIETNGHALSVVSIAGDINQQSTSATAPSIDMIGSSSSDADRELILVADGDVGTTAAPIRTRGVAKLAGQAPLGDFVLDNVDAAGSGLHITRLSPRDPAVVGEPVETTPYVGVLAGSRDGPGSIDITSRDNPGGPARIVLAELSDGLEFTSSPHLIAEDDVRLHADAIEIENARIVEANLPVVGPVFLPINDARIVAGEDVVLGGPVRTSLASEAVDPDGDEVFVHGKLRIEAGGTTAFHGDVGTGAAGDTAEEQDQRQLALLDTTAASAEGTGQTRIFRVGEAHFRGTLGGPAGVQVIAHDLDGDDPDHQALATFDGNLGSQQRLASLDVQAEQIRFTSANSISATGDVSLATNQTSTPPAATIIDTQGGLGIETDGAFTTAVNDKLTVMGPLSIRAGSVQVGDVNAARELVIDSQQIAIRARAGAPIMGKDGQIIEDANGDPIPDRGTDLVADRIRLSSVPTIVGPDGLPTADPDPVRLGVGGGGIQAPGGVFQSFEVVYATPGIDQVTAGGMQATDGTVLDLQATGRPIVGDPSQDLPRERPQPHPSLAPRLGDDGPAPAPGVDAAQLLAFLRCGDLGGPAADCDAADAELLRAVPDWSDSALATPRAEQIAQSYREMRSRDLSAAFDAAGTGFREAQGFGEFDAPAFARYLEQSPDHPEARAAIHQLASLLVEVDLLGLSAEDEARVRRELADALAAEADLPGFDADAVLDAVEATPIELPE